MMKVSILSEHRDVLFTEARMSVKIILLSYRQSVARE